MSDLEIDHDGVSLAGEEAGEGPPVVLLHGLTATRRYVVMGSRSLERSGHRVITYDARGHGRSSPAPDPGAYGYPELRDDLQAVLDGLDVRRAVLAGSSMGAHTALSFALHAPDRVAGLVVITPAYDPETNDDPERLARWDALADGLERGGVEGFVEAYGEPDVPPALRETVLKVVRQRLALHEHPEAVADALRAVPRSRPFEAVEDLGAIGVPVAVVASADEADPGHPRAIGEAYAAAIRGARLVTDTPGRSPVAWQGSQLSRIIADVVSEAGVGGGEAGAGPGGGAAGNGGGSGY
jgi:pimeloyl-ACP methyl ester carboxylesterase